MADEERILVTGAGGFVGQLVTAALARDAEKRPLRVFAATRGETVALPARADPVVLDVADDGAASALVAELRPTAVVHLAAVAAPAKARADQELAWRVNVLGTLSIAAALRRHAPDARLLFAGSSEAYGDSLNAASPEGTDENAAFLPQTAYAATKAAADLMLGAMARDGLNVVRFRPFNHTGPGQENDYVVAAFAEQVARIEHGLQEPTITVGNLDAERDFLDARDVARAYAIAASPARRFPPGLALNLASGRPVRIGDILRELVALSPRTVRIAVDPARLRPSEVPVTRGNAARAREFLGWVPEIPLETTLRDVLDARRAALRGETEAT